MFTRSICGNQAAGKAEEDEEAEQVAVPTLYQALSQPRRSSWSFWATFSSSDSMAARLSISGSCRHNERKRHIVCKQSYVCINFSCTTALKISWHNYLPCHFSLPVSKDTLQAEWPLLVLLLLYDKCVPVCSHRGCQNSVSDFLWTCCQAAALSFCNFIGFRQLNKKPNSGFWPWANEHSA